MPATLAFAAFQAGAPLAVVNAIAGVGIAGAITHFAVQAGISVGLSIAANALLRPKVSASDGQIESKQPIPPRLIHYGRLKVSGPLGFLAVSDFNNALFKTIILSAREIAAIESHYLNGTPVELDEPSGLVLSGFETGGTFYAYVFSHLGTDTQLADADLLSAFPDIWTANHRALGVAYAVVRLDQPDLSADVVKVYPQGAPEYQALIRGSKVYDLRKDSTNGGSGSHRTNDKTTWEWSENAALCALDWLAYEDGYNKGFSRIDWPSWLAKINRDDELVLLKSGSAEARYRVATTCDLANEAKKDVLARLRAAGDARLFFTETGKIGIRGGAWEAPTVALDLDQTLIEAELGPGGAGMGAYNILEFKYLSPQHDYVEQDGDPWRDEAAITALGGVEKKQQIDLSFVPSHAQARRLAKIMSGRDNPAWTGAGKFKLPGIQAVGEDVIDLTFAELDAGSGDVNGPYWVDGEVEPDIATGTVTVTIKSALPASYDWDAATEEGTAPTVPFGTDPLATSILADDLDETITDDEDEILIDEAA